ncbi:MAG: HYR domain-containing protein, partial [Thermoleophilia bacterium]
MRGRPGLDARFPLFISLLSVLAGLTIATPVLLRAEAQGSQPTDWNTVAQAIDGYVQSQYSATDDGEAGFLIAAPQLKARIDPLGNDTFLGEGADAANAPVLVDVLNTWGQQIPDTSMGVTENSNAASVANSQALAVKVQAHRAAGMSTDIVTYCWTGHVDNKVAMAYGAMGQAGYFGSPAPRVYALRWGREGWNFAITPAPGPYPFGVTGNRPYSAAAVTPATGTLPAAVPGGCTSAGGNADLVRCAAQWALVNLGPGVSPWRSLSDGSYQPIDLRSTVDSYLGSGAGSGAGATYAFPDQLDTLFNVTGGTYNNLAKLSTTRTNVFYNRTQHSAMLAALGAKMLGFNVSGLRWGLPSWSAVNPPNWQEKLVGPGNSYPCVGTSPCTAPGPATDTTVPTITAAPSVSGLTDTAATFSWNTSEPTTAKLDIGTAPGTYTIHDNSTILHANHSAGNARSVSGLNPSTTYYYIATSYDENANSVTSSEQSFTTAAPPDTTPPVITIPGPVTAEATGPAGAAVSYTATATDLVDGSVATSCSPASGSTFALGVTAVSCTATDSHANTASAGFNVTVADTTAPVITVPAPVTAEA